MTNKGGFTLVEAVMTAGAAGIVALIAASMMLQVTRFDRQVSARAGVQRDSRISLEVIERELSQARGRSILIDRYDADQPPYSRVTFGTLDGRTISYYQRGSRLYRRLLVNGAPSTAVVATGLRRVVFSYPMSDAAALVSIGLTFERKTYQGRDKSLQLSLAKVRVQNPDAY